MYFLAVWLLVFGFFNVCGLFVCFGGGCVVSRFGLFVFLDFFFLGCCLLCEALVVFWVFSFLFFFTALMWLLLDTQWLPSHFIALTNPYFLPCILYNVASICTQVVLNYR